MNLSSHFTLAEFTASQAAARDGLDNMPSPRQIDNMKRVAMALELVREAIDEPIIISSGFRSPIVNAAVGGAQNSAHTRGAAVDFIAPKFGTPFQLATRIIKMGFAFDQLIYEYTWVHLAIEPPTRQQVLTLKHGGGYANGLMEDAR